MAAVVFEVTSYSLRLGKGGFGTTPIHCPATIIVNGGKDFRCIFRFVDDDPLPASMASARTADIFVAARHYPWYVDLLRYERPVRCTINQGEPEFSYLATGEEPAGEGEQVIRA
jgi:hypothetical protein